MVYHVAKWGNDQSSGSEISPFETISRGAELAMPGDTVLVHAGTYREQVSPTRGGTSEQRITYAAAPGEHVVIKGSEQITNWEPYEGDTWYVKLEASFFGDFNPYREKIEGDWLIYPDQFGEPVEQAGVLTNFMCHLGDVYMNELAFYEAGRLADVLRPRPRKYSLNAPWVHPNTPHPYIEDTVSQWYAEVDPDGTTTIYANFHGANPNQELTEINVRKACFYPAHPGCNFITVRGLEMAQAASPWAPPTADQPGLLGVNWGKGWIIENNHIHDAKCAGISLGKDSSTGHNLCTRTQRKPGYQYQLETVFLALANGWSKETVGSHIVRNNTIHDCGQAGIVGNLGCIFSEITHNHIYSIARKNEFYGYELAGIKLHAAIDVQLAHNCIHDCTFGTWLDWQAQGARVSGNVYFENDRDFVIEVTHGPYLVDHNIFGSSCTLDNAAQGGAYLHNLFCGTMRRASCLDRATPYHFPHSTAVAGTALVYGGDDRFLQNIFLGNCPVFCEHSKDGTFDYDAHPDSWDTYESTIRAGGNGDHEKFDRVPQAVSIHANAYLSGARAYCKEQDLIVSKEDIRVSISMEDDCIWLTMNVPDVLLKMNTKILTSEMLGTPRISECPYESPDGLPVLFLDDMLGNSHSDHPVPGPIELTHSGINRICVWQP